MPSACCAHASGFADNEHVCTTVVTEPTWLLSFLYSMGNVQLIDKPTQMLFAAVSFAQIVSKITKEIWSQILYVICAWFSEL
jgi:hypothetical protein